MNGGMTNSQTPMTNETPSPNDELTIPPRADWALNGHSSLVIEHWSLIGHWGLVIGHSLND
jgi:hypothetical protein